VPTVAGGKDEVVIVKAGELIVSDRAAVADAELESVTFTVRFDEPAAVGVPDIVPALRVNPAGREPLVIDHEYGGDPPVALSCCE
jgi:hypothetical protein